jgi:hypothetical protein
VTADIRRYLERVLPWPPLGNPNSYKSISYTFTPQTPSPDGKFPMAERAAQTLDEVVELVESAMRGRSNRDIYVCMGTQRIAAAQVARNGTGYTRAVRTQQNALELRALFADIDAGNKGYADTGEAVRELVEFCDTIDLPRPQVLVASGSGGIHVYWCMDRALPVAEWQPLAHALANAIRKYGLQCDAQCTVDSVRLLRVPGTRNYKTDHPTDVSLITASQDDFTVEQLWTALQPFAQSSPATPAGNLAVLPQRATPVVSELAAGIEARQARPVVLDDVAKECGFIREALATGGAAYPQPLWNLTTLVSVFAENGRDMAHKMASGHPGYDHTTTDALYDRKERERDAKNLGWPSCQSISVAGCASCATCPHLAAQKTPLHHGRAAATPLNRVSDLPEHYHRATDGLVLKRQVSEAGVGEFVPVCSYPMDEAWLQSTPWILHFTTTVDRVTKIQVPFDVLGRREAMLSALLRQGMPVQIHDAAKLQEFFMSWIQTLQKQKEKVVAAVPFGWVDKGAKLEGFAFGGLIHTPEGQHAAAAPSPVLANQYGPNGDVELWKLAAKITTDQRRPALDAIIAAAFAGPLVRMTGHSGFILSAYSQESGKGKSTAMDTAQAVWANHKTAKQGLADTVNTINHKLGALRNLPLFWDEIKEEEQYRKFVQIAFSLSQGKEKARLNSAAEMKEVTSWQTLMMVASNDSLMDHVERHLKTTAAGVLRIFEWVVPPAVEPSALSVGYVTRTIDELARNGGQAGLLYAQFLGENHAKVAKEVADIQSRCEKNLNGTQEERFWMAAIATLLAGAKFANQLGLTDIDIKGLAAFLRDTLAVLRRERLQSPVDMTREENVATVLTRFLKMMRPRNMLITNVTIAGRGRPRKGEVKILQATDRLEAVYVQVGMNDKVLRIDATYLREWLVKNGYSPSIVQDAMIQKYGMRRTTARIGAGTSLSCGTERVYDLQLAGTPLADDLADLLADNTTP